MGKLPKKPPKLAPVVLADPALLRSRDGTRDGVADHRKSPRKALYPGVFAEDLVDKLPDRKRRPWEHLQGDNPSPPKGTPLLRDIVGRMPDRMTITEIPLFVNRECGLVRGEVPSPWNTYSAGQIKEAMRENGFRMMGKKKTLSQHDVDHGNIVVYIRAGSYEEEKMIRREAERAAALEKEKLAQQGLPPPETPLTGQILRERYPLAPDPDQPVQEPPPTKTPLETQP